MQNSFSVLSAMFTPAVLISAWLPNTLGIVGTVFLFYGCVMLIAETRLALRSVKSEMEFTLMLRAKYQQRRDAALAEMEKEI